MDTMREFNLSPGDLFLRKTENGLPGGRFIIYTDKNYSSETDSQFVLILEPSGHDNRVKIITGKGELGWIFANWFNEYQKL